jgi:hypothetical protein
MADCVQSFTPRGAGATHLNNFRKSCCYSLFPGCSPEKHFYAKSYIVMPGQFSNKFPRKPKVGVLVFEATLSVYGKIQQMPERKNFKLFEAGRPSF